MSTTTPIHWILDWDGTLTKTDTLNALVHIAATSKPSTPILDRWKQVVDAYMADYTTTLEELAPKNELPTTLGGESKLLKDLEPVEHRSLSRVYAAKIFEGVTKKQIEDGAKAAIETGDVALRPGVIDFFQRIKARGDGVHILSVNWSRHFIHSCLASSDISLHASLILAIELDGVTEDVESNGRISGDIVSSGDKMRELQKLRSTSSAPVVYVGDSWTDIECLLAADMGICIRDEPMGSGQRKLADALERLGVPCGPLSELGGAGLKGVVWARDFIEIERLADRQRGAEGERAAT